MDTNELNIYIKNYLKNDKTQRAIMLTAPWGSGKSYYIKNSLCPFLLKNELDYAIVSLYGLKEIKDLNKELYLEIKFKKSHKTKAAALASAFGKTVLSGAVGIGKTILKHVANVDIDFNLKEPNYEKLYESVNLKDRLIIFEDVERSEIDIIEFMGYVNNIVEQDGIKVLIVANESEIIKTESFHDEKLDTNIDIYTTETKKYLKIKEKTVGDTVCFTGSSLEIIEGIYSLFNNEFFQLMINHENEFTRNNIYQKIQDVMQLAKCDNYRSLLYACQKTEEIFNKLEKSDYDIYYLQNVLLGTIAYCVNGHCANNTVWNEASVTSTTLGMTKFPLLRFMYDYIKFQYFRVSDFDFCYELFNKAKEQAQKDKHLIVIYNYPTSEETEVNNALKAINDALNKDKGLVHNEYVKLANYLISIKYNVGFKTIIDKCLNQMLKNVKNAVQKGEEVQTYLSSGIQPLSPEEVEEFNNFKNKIYKIVSEKQDVLKFDYNPQSIEEYHTDILMNKRTFINEGGFANKLDTNKIIEMFKLCTPKQIEEFRGILQYIYMGHLMIQERYI